MKVRFWKGFRTVGLKVVLRSMGEVRRGECVWRKDVRMVVPMGLESFWNPRVGGRWRDRKSNIVDMVIGIRVLV